jgi:hypothetical protein
MVRVSIYNSFTHFGRSSGSSKSGQWKLRTDIPRLLDGYGPGSPTVHVAAALLDDFTKVRTMWLTQHTSQNPAQAFLPIIKVPVETPRQGDLVSDRTADFTGSIPIFLRSWASPGYSFAEFVDDIARRVVAPAPKRVLEIAADTGIATLRLRDLLPREAHLAATDLML